MIGNEHLSIWWFGRWRMALFYLHYVKFTMFRRFNWMWWHFGKKKWWFEGIFVGKLLGRSHHCWLNMKMIGADSTSAKDSWGRLIKPVDTEFGVPTMTTLCWSVVIQATAGETRLKWKDSGLISSIWLAPIVINVLFPLGAFIEGPDQLR